MFFAATRHFAFFDGFHKISGLNSVLKDEECFQRNQLCFFDKNWTGFWFMLDFCSVFARLPLDFCSTMLEIEQKILLEK